MYSKNYSISKYNQCWASYFVDIIHYILLFTFGQVISYSYTLLQMKSNLIYYIKLLLSWPCAFDLATTAS